MLAGAYQAVPDCLATGYVEILGVRSTGHLADWYGPVNDR